MSGIMNVLVALSPTPRLTNRTVSASAEYPNNATAELEFNTSGGLNTVVDSGSGGVTTSRLPEWYGFNYSAGWPAGTHYEIRCTVQSGSSPSSGSAAVDTWLALTAAREWFLFRNSPGTSSGTWLIEIRPTNGSVIASATYTMSAEQALPSAEVTVTGRTIDSGTGAFLSYVQVHFRSDGTVDREVNGATTQIDSSTDWIIPNASASGDYQVMFQLTSGTTPNLGDSLNTWHALSSDRSFGLQVTDTDASVTVSVSIRIAGVTQDSGSYTLQVHGGPV